MSNEKSYIGFNGAFYGKYTEKTDKNGNVTTTFSPYGKKATLTKIIRDIEGDTYLFKLSYTYGNSDKEITVSRGELEEKTNCKMLADKGVAVRANTFDAFGTSIIIQEEDYFLNNNPEYLSYRHLGWIETPIFNEDKEKRFYYRAEDLIGEGETIEGEYTGNFKITPMGSLKEWKRMVREEVLPHIPISIVLLCSLSAVTSALLSFRYPIGNGILHLCAVSSAGKSTSAWLASSIAGVPFTVVQQEYDSSGNLKLYSSILQSFAATNNALIGKLAGNCGVPIVLDEIGKYRGSDLTETIFNLFDGNDKSRLNQELQICEQPGFRGTIITVGETDIFEKCKSKLEGIRNRVFKMTSKLTVSAEHSNRIKQCCAENNGKVAPKLAEFILDNGGFEYVAEKYEYWLEVLPERLPKVTFVEKFTENFAAIYLATADISKEALGLEFNIEGIIKYFCEYLSDENNTMNVSKGSYEVMLEEFAVHSNNFYCEQGSNKINTHAEIWGRYNKCNKTTASGKKIVGEWLVRPKIVKKIIKDNNYVLEQCKQSWKDNEQISRDKDRPTRSRTIEIGKKDEDVFVFNVFGQEEDKGDA